MAGIDNIRRAPGIFGHRTTDYPVERIMREACAAYRIAASNYDLYNKIYDDHKDVASLEKLFEQRSEMMRHGTIALVMAVTTLDRDVYHYTCFRLHYKDVESTFRNMGFFQKWMFTLEKVKQLKIDSSHPTLKALKHLVTARNSIVHQKTEWITTEGFDAKADGVNEWEIFKIAARELENTYAKCHELLNL